MMGIVRKDAGAFALLLLFVVPGSWLYLLATRDALDFGVVFVVGALSYLVLMVPVLHNEIHESRHGGYLFLAALPIGRLQLVQGKFAAPLAASIVYALQSFALFARFEAAGGALAFARACALVNLALGLCLVGLYYAGVFRFGFTALLRYAAVVIVVIPYVAAMLLDDTVAAMLGGDIERFAWFFRSPLPAAVVAAALAAYASLMRSAARTKEVAR